MQKIKCIDFHTHIFPDALAPRAIAALVEGGKHLYLPNADGRAYRIHGQIGN